MPAESIDEALRRQFEAACAAGEFQPIGAFLPPEHDARHLPTLEELVLIELEFRWKWWAGRGNCDTHGAAATEDHAPPRVEDYLQRFPRLNRPEIVRRLVEQELLVRRQAGSPVSLDEYRSRFPGIEPIVGGESATRGVAPASFSHEPFLAAGQASDRSSETHPGRSDRTRFGNYELLEEIGRGGMGVVYRARQWTADRIVALKMVRPDHLAGVPSDLRSTVMDRFRQEAQAAARLEHESIVSVYEVGEIEGTPFYSMRYVEGRSLADRLRLGPLSNRVAAAYLESVALAVEAAHGHGILHRDLKPPNILIDVNTDRAMVADFGLAKLTEGGDELTQSGDVVGSPPYMSPEQAQHASRVTAESDVYALGATLYHALTGRPPFHADTALETLRQVLHDEPVPPRRLSSAVNPDWRRSA